MYVIDWRRFKSSLSAANTDIYIYIYVCVHSLLPYSTPFFVALAYSIQSTAPTCPFQMCFGQASRSNITVMSPNPFVITIPLDEPVVLQPQLLLQQQYNRSALLSKSAVYTLPLSRARQ